VPAVIRPNEVSRLLCSIRAPAIGVNKARAQCRGKRLFASIGVSGLCQSGQLVLFPVAPRIMAVAFEPVGPKGARGFIIETGRRASITALFDEQIPRADING